MDLSVSLLAHDRIFAKAMRRIRPRIESLAQGFRSVEMDSPLDEALLISFVDKKAPTFFEEVPNLDGYYQVIVGVPPGAPDDELFRHVVSMVREAITRYQFSDPDRRAFLDFMDAFAAANNL